MAAWFAAGAVIKGTVSIAEGTLSQLNSRRLLCGLTVLCKPNCHCWYSLCNRLKVPVSLSFSSLCQGVGINAIFNCTLKKWAAATYAPWLQRRWYICVSFFKPPLWGVVGGSPVGLSHSIKVCRISMYILQFYFAKIIWERGRWL